MKKIILSFLALLALLVSCNKDIETPATPAEPVQQEKQLVDIHVTIPAGATKVALSPDAGTNGLKLAWEEGDCIRVTSGSNSSVFTIKPGFTEHEATFTGEPVEGTAFEILYPGTYETAAAAQAAFTTSLTQNGNGNTDHLKWTASIAGVDSYEDITFTAGWAEAHGGTFNRPGAVKLAALLPNDATGIEKAVLEFAGETFTLNLLNVDVSASGQILSAYLMLPWGDTVLPAGEPVKISVYGSDNSVYSVSVSPASETTLAAGRTSVFSFVKSALAEQPFYGGSGVDGDPYLIGNAKHMVSMNSTIAANAGITWFKLIDDIDMSGVTDWVSQNTASPYDHGVNFDGDGHTIDKFSCSNCTYAGMFGVLYGVYRNVYITNAAISQNFNTACGILGGYAGSGDIHADIINVHVHGTVNFTGNKTGIGGLVGTVGNATIERCSADCDVYSVKNYVGGLFGFSRKVTVRDCWTAGSVRGDQRVGGICGGILGQDDAIYNCYSVADLNGRTSDVAAVRSVGGIVGHANLDKGGNNTTNMPNNTVSGCIAWQDAIKTRDYLGETVTTSYYSSGAIIAYTATHNNLTNCYRKSSLDFSDFAGAFSLYDQEDASPTNELVIQEVAGSTHNYPYHGKAAAPGKTLSEVAQSIGWSSDVWDFSGSLPTLK